MKKYLLTLCSLVLSVGLIAGCSSGGQQSETTTPVTQKPPVKDTTPAQPARPGKYKEYPAMTIDINKKYTATLSTSMGDIVIELFAKDAPKTVNNFVFLAKDHFYDGLKFHRVIKDFMIQTGDPTSRGGSNTIADGTGGPGYYFEDELNNGHIYEPGVVSMANAGKNTNGSQFFIGSGDDVKALKNAPYYTIFGKVTKGMDVVQKIESVKVKENPVIKEPSVPVTPVTIKTIAIAEK